MLFKRFSLMLILVGASAFAQTTAGTNGPKVPSLINTAEFHWDAAGQAASGTATFAIYGAQDAVTPLWTEIQTVTPDASGHFTVLLGSTKPEGLPTGIFANGDARWIGVTLNGAPEQPRTPLVSVPYAIKASDSETLGGRPASDYALAGTASTGTIGSSPTQSPQIGAPIDNGGSDGTPNYLAKFDSASTIVNSVIFESGGLIGLGTSTPAVRLDIRDTGVVNIPPNLPTVLINQSNDAADGLVSYANGVNGIGTGLHGISYGELGGYRRWGESRAQGHNNSGLYGSAQGGGAGGWFEAYPDDITQSSTAILARSFYTNTIAAAFVNLSGDGKILSLQSGPQVDPNDYTSSPEVLSVDGSGNLASIGNVNAHNATFTGTLSANNFSGSGLSLTNLNAASISSGVLSTSRLPSGANGVPLLDSSGLLSASVLPSVYLPLTGGTLTGDVAGTNATMSGSLTAGSAINLPTTTDALHGVINVGGVGFAHRFGHWDTFVGESAGNFANTLGGQNTAVGYQALMSTTVSSSDTAVGSKALSSNTSGSFNTAVGSNSLTSNTDGSGNTGAGYSSLQTNTSGYQNTAMGLYSMLNNSMEIQILQLVPALLPRTHQEIPMWRSAFPPSQVTQAASLTPRLELQP